MKVGRTRLTKDTMVSGADTVQAAIRSMRAAERQVQRMRYRRSIRGLVHDAGPEDWHPYPCALLCGACGYLLPGPPPTDPFRARDVTTACPHCHGTAWIDLRHVPMVEALQETDAYEAPARLGTGRRTIRRLLQGAGASAWIVGVGVLLWAVATQTRDPIYFTLMATALVPIALYAGNAIREYRARGRRKPLPARWRLALPPAADGTASTARGPACAAAELLTAPLSGRPCVAYELGARLDDTTAADLGTWMLLEQASTALEIDGVRVAPDGVYLDLPRGAVDPALAGIHPDTIARALRQRGLDPLDPSLVLFETIVEPGENCELRRSATGGTSVLRRAS